LKPQEVIDKSQMIVTGKYDIPYDQGRFNKGMWVPFNFTVDKYYQGSDKQLIQVAIEQFDVGWAKEFQDESYRGRYRFQPLELYVIVFFPPVFHGLPMAVGPSLFNCVSRSGEC